MDFVTMNNMLQPTSSEEDEEMKPMDINQSEDNRFPRWLHHSICIAGIILCAYRIITWW